MGFIDKAAQKTQIFFNQFNSRHQRGITINEDRTLILYLIPHSLYIILRNLRDVVLLDGHRIRYIVVVEDLKLQVTTKSVQSALCFFLIMRIVLDV